MARPICKAYVARNAEIAARYAAGEGLGDLADKHGLTSARLRVILTDQGTVLRIEPHRDFSQRRSKNKLMVLIGARLDAHRMKHRLSLAELSVSIGLGESRLSEALHGNYNWKLKELQRAAFVLETPLDAFVRPSGL